jgi:hypothetical protein
MIAVGYRTLVPLPVLLTPVLLALGALGGCTGSGAGLDANGNPISSGGNVPLTPDLASIQANIFTPICTKCHIGAGAPEGLQLDEAHSYSLLVGVPSQEVPTLNRVKPADPNNSYIILKLQGSSGIVGGQMPLGGPYLPQSTIDVIKQWITNGAPQATSTTVVASSMANSKSMDRAAGAASTPEPFAVTVTSPANESVATEPVARLVVGFTQEVDRSLVSSTTVTLERVGPAFANMTSDSTPVQLTASFALASGNPSTLLIMPAAPLGPGTYRVTLRGTGGGALASVGAQTLGTDYSFVFAVDLSQ